MLLVFIAIISSYTCESDTSYDWRLHGESCYRLSLSSYSNVQGRVNCDHGGGIFSSILSAEENNFVHSLFYNRGIDSVWIGGTYSDDSNVTWMDGR